MNFKHQPRNRSALSATCEWTLDVRTKKMRALTGALAGIAILLYAAQVVGSDKADFQTANDSEIDGICTFKLSKTNRAFLKVGDGDYFILELIDSSRESDWETFTETCSISWTLIKSDSIQTGTASGLVRYKSKQLDANSFVTLGIGGSNEILLGGDASIRWAYDSRRSIFLIPSSGTVFATTEVEQAETHKP